MKRKSILIFILFSFFLANCNEKESCKAFDISHLHRNPYQYQEDLLITDGDTTIELKLDGFRFDSVVEYFENRIFDIYPIQCSPTLELHYSVSAEKNVIPNNYIDFSFTFNYHNTDTNVLTFLCTVNSCEFKVNYDTLKVGTGSIHFYQSYGDKEKVVQLNLIKGKIDSYKTETGKIWKVKTKRKRKSVKYMDSDTIIK